MLNGLSKDVSIKTDDRINQYTERSFKSAHFFIEFIGRVEENREKARLAEHFISFSQRV